MGHSDNRRVLVIDDEPSIHEDFRSVLATPKYDEADARFDRLGASLFGNEPDPPNQGFHLSSAFQGRDGLELARAALAEGQPFSVAFVDMRMPPGWDGLRTAKELLNLDPRLQIVFCTAYADHSWQQSLQQLQPQDGLLVVKKPFDPIEVWQAALTLHAKWMLARRAEAMMARLYGKPGDPSEEQTPVRP